MSNIDFSKIKKIDKTISIEDRIGFLRYCAQQYETNGTSPITDAVYDQEFYELQSLDPNNDFFDEVGGIASDIVQGQIVPHKVIMGSLNKSLDIESFDKWIRSRYPSNFKGVFVLQHKIDGLSLGILYRNGKLVQALTRGDGIQGTDVTEKAKKVNGVLLSIPCKEEVEVRGECYKDKKDFYKNWHKSVGGDYKNPRNFASGKMNEKDPEETAKAGLNFIGYEVVRKDFTFETEKNTWLEQQGFATLNSSTKYTKDGLTFDQIVRAVKIYMDTIDRANLTYDIDGIVVKLNDVKEMKSLGYDSRGRKPNANRAVKFPPIEKETKLIGVEVNVGRTGKLTPVALLDPIDLEGAIISRATLHNFGALVGEDAIKIGAIVKIAKKGDIIPQITEVKSQGDKAIDIPTKCPSCGEKVEWTDGNVDLVCNNPLCIAQLNKNIEKWFTVIGVKGFGPGTIARLTNKDFMEWDEKPIVSSLSEMYWILDNDRNTKHPFRKYEYLKQNLGAKTYDNLLISIKAVKEVSMSVFIEALGIPHIGSSAKDIANIAPTVKDIDNLTIDDLLKIENFGSIKAQNFISGWVARRKEIDILLKHISIIADKKSSDKLKGKKFCFTGSFSKSRSELEALVNSNGGKACSSISNGVILVWDGSEMGNKYNKATKDGNNIISETDFWAMLK
jgi:DNA ligase (NAD+)